MTKESNSVAAADAASRRGDAESGQGDVAAAAEAARRQARQDPLQHSAP